MTDDRRCPYCGRQVDVPDDEAAHDALHEHTSECDSNPFA